ncbi:MAG: hypothetical protein J5767_02940 [Paludibacteraceae bacterium]|nr:hypothetical protein [Paludibacteraceae bacterium]
MRNLIKYILCLLSVFVLISCSTNPRMDWSPNLDGSYDPFATGHLRYILNRPYGWSFVYVNFTGSYTGRISNWEDTTWFSQASNLLWVEYSVDPLDMSPHNADSLWARNENGKSTIIACDNFGELITSRPHPFIIDSFANEINANKRCNISVIKNHFAYTICDDEEECISDTTYNFPTQLCQSRIFHDPNSEFLNRYAEHRVLATIDSEPIAIQYIHENGSSLIFVSTPLLFTNYGLFYEKNAKLILNFLQLAKGVDWGLLTRSSVSHREMYESKPPMVKSDKRNTANEDYGNVLKSWRDRLITWSVIALFIGFLLFLARRRERIIPVIKKPENRTISFAQQMGRNYMWKEEYQTMIKKKFVAFISQLQDEKNINLNDMELLDANIETLEKLTGEKNLNRLINNLFYILNKEHIDFFNETMDISFKEMKYYIDRLNKITSKLK